MLVSSWYLRNCRNSCASSVDSEKGFRVPNAAARWMCSTPAFDPKRLRNASNRDIKFPCICETSSRSFASEMLCRIQLYIAVAKSCACLVHWCRFQITMPIGHAKMTVGQRKSPQWRLSLPIITESLLNHISCALMKRGANLACRISCTRNLPAAAHGMAWHGMACARARYEI